MIIPEGRKELLKRQLTEERKFWVVMREIWRTSIATADNSIRYLDEELRKLEG